MALDFAKYEGLGNDFVIVECAPDALALGEVERICDRHLGVGADGVLFVDRDEPRMTVINADGSRPQMCGNGIRCVALHLSRTGHQALAEGAAVDIQTDAGPHRCRLIGQGEDAQVEVLMRPPSLHPADLPVVAEGPLRDAPFVLDGRQLRLTAVSMGNPHAVVFEDFGLAPSALGPLLAADARFPEGVNVGFARLVGDGALELKVLERGAGWTRACGTGACAAAVAAVETGRIERGRPIDVTLPGGTLRIDVGEAGAPLGMTGPARHVFDGRLAGRG